MSDRVKPPKVGSPITFRAQKDGPEHVVRPCSGRCRELWLSGYIVLSCTKCTRTIQALAADVENTKEGTWPATSAPTVETASTLRATDEHGTTRPTTSPSVAATVTMRPPNDGR